MLPPPAMDDCAVCSPALCVRSRLFQAVAAMGRGAEADEAFEVYLDQDPERADFEPIGLAAKLKAKGRIQPHRDGLHSFHMGHRIHIPITTNPSVRFMIAGKP